MYLRQKQHSTNTLFTFLLLLVFTLFALLLAGTGAVVYQNSVASLDENYTSRTAIAYVAEKIRQYDSEGQISFSSVEDIPALALHSEANATTATITYLFFYDGSLCELYVREETTPTVLMSTAIVELSDFTIEQDENLLRVTAISTDGKEMSLLIHPVNVEDGNGKEALAVP
ncbi:MAG: DUF4860 domain-containing protein [Clostridiales bacterium]|nr:DUF4860 domain-containing protein [Clostridiales bacterium]